MITGFLGRTKDRFHDYNDQRNLEEKLSLLAGIPGYSGAEIVFPYEASDAATTVAILKKTGLSMAAVNANIKAEPGFRAGGISSPDPVIRAQAVKIIKDAKDFAASTGADKVTCCPLGDGFEFAFQYDYSTARRRMTECFAEAAAYRPEVPLFIEYKPSETRGTCFVDTAASTLCMIRDMAVPGVGVTLDFGHSVYAGETPAYAASMVLDSGTPLYVHINDNDGKWDWDYFCGTKHYLEYVEFLWYLRRAGYSGWFTSDTSPTRWDISKTFETNSRLTTRIWDLVGELEAEGFGALVGASDYHDTWQVVEDRILGLKRS